MIFEQYYLECLSQASYLVADETSGRAVVVDPRRDIEQYLESAKQHGVTIELVVDTHFHADFLSGHLELAQATGAQIAFGARAKPEFAALALRDGQRISLGQVTLEVLETPGHTPESISIVVYEHADDEVPYGVLTGDTLFIGDVGRPDLLSSRGTTSDELADMLYDSLTDKLMTLPDATRVFPGHGAGSACGKNMSTDLTSTIGHQRAANYALQPMSRAQFVHVVTEGQASTPAYFGYDARRNREAHELLYEHEHPVPLSIDEAVERGRQGAVLLDTRPPSDFARGNLRGSVNVGLDGRYAQYVGSVVRPDEDIVLVAEPGTELEAKVRLSRIGYDRVVGYVDNLYDVIQQQPELMQVGSRLTAGAFDERRRAVPDLQVVDVRDVGETEQGSVNGAINIPLPRFRDELEILDPARPTVVYCAGGYRSSIAASMLRQVGFDDVSDVLGGYHAWEAAQSRPGATT
jgi:glyoxylase-like metal-dependent hydrolase (beta-lactamase superfamily II)/rhodanese-related sulfurtransferase